MGRGVNPKSMSQRCLQAVLAGGEMTVRQVLGVVGKHITSAHAVARAKAKLKSEGVLRRKDGSRRNEANKIYQSNKYMVDWGKYIIVIHALKRLKDTGKLRRVRPGVYALPIAKLYQPPQVG